MSRFLELQCHPGTPPARITGVAVELSLSGDDLRLVYSVGGGEHLLLPARKAPACRDELWRTTCFELFLRAGEDDAYLEFNFSPSTEWAAYHFHGYREGMAGWPCAVAPVVKWENEPGGFAVQVDLNLGGMAPAPLRVGLSAVIEERDGTRSYWALAHPPGKPDFHHPACFALELPAPSSA